MSHLEDASLAPSAIQRPFWQRLFCRWADRLAYGQLTVVFPDGYRHLASGARQGPVATVQFNSRRSLLRLMTAGSNGFAKAYIDGDVDTPDLNALLDLIVDCGYVCVDEGRRVRARTLTRALELEHRCNLAKRQACRLRISDEPQPFNYLVAIVPVAACRSRGLVE